MVRTKVAIIDGLVNLLYLNNYYHDIIKIKGAFHVDGRCVVKGGELEDSLSHATLCAKIFCDNIKNACDVYFINIFDVNSNTTEIDKLMVALEWCHEKDIDVVNLSLGTIQLKDIKRLSSFFGGTRLGNMIVVAAHANSGKMTFPACFPNVIGVFAINSQKKQKNLICLRLSDFGVFVGCVVKGEIIHYNQEMYEIYKSNSFAAPLITAKVANDVSIGYSIGEIYNQIIISDSNDSLKRMLYKIKKTYCKNTLVPIIGFIYSDKFGYAVKSLIQRILQELGEKGYEGICVSDTEDTDLSIPVFNTKHSIIMNKLNINQLIEFWANYCETDFVLLCIKDKEWLCRIKPQNIDVILHDGCFLDKGIRCNNIIEVEDDLDKVITSLFDLLIK